MKNSNKTRRVRLRRKAAVVIQKRFRYFLKRRYSGTISNFDDDDFITSEPMYHIPRKILYVTPEKIGFNGASLLIWLCKKKVNPYTGRTIQKTVLDTLYKTILEFVCTDRCLQQRSGFYRKKKLYKKAMRAYENKYIKII